MSQKESRLLEVDESECGAIEYRTQRSEHGAERQLSVKRWTLPLIQIKCPQPRMAAANGKIINLNL